MISSISIGSIGFSPWRSALEAPDGLGMAQGWPSAYQSVFGLKDGGPTLWDHLKFLEDGSVEI
jgi:hypothetical protein